MSVVNLVINGEAIEIHRMDAKRLRGLFEPTRCFPSAAPVYSMSKGFTITPYRKDKYLGIFGEHKDLVEIQDTYGNKHQFIVNGDEVENIVTQINERIPWRWGE